MSYLGSAKHRTHRAVAEKALGRPLKGSEGVHHWDNNKRNNEPSNLLVFPDNAYHQLMHIRADALDACGNANYRKCQYCKTYDDPANLINIDRSRPNGKYAHQKCKLKYYRNWVQGLPAPKNY